MSNKIKPRYTNSSLLQNKLNNTNQKREIDQEIKEINQQYQKSLNLADTKRTNQLQNLMVIYEIINRNIQVVSLNKAQYAQQIERVIKDNLQALDKELGLNGFKIPKYNPDYLFKTDISRIGNAILKCLIMEFTDASNKKRARIIDIVKKIAAQNPSLLPKSKSNISKLILEMQKIEIFVGKGYL